MAVWEGKINIPLIGTHGPITITDTLTSYLARGTRPSTRMDLGIGNEME
jgi:hypothetical protein